MEHLPNAEFLLSNKCYVASSLLQYAVHVPRKQVFSKWPLKCDAADRLCNVTKPTCLAAPRQPKQLHTGGLSGDSYVNNIIGISHTYCALPIIGPSHTSIKN
eukprot:1140964-Pelagomonas_calceolata.AAC.2